MVLLRNPEGVTWAGGLALAVDGATMLYEVVGQMCIGTYVTCRHARDRKRQGGDA